MPMVVVDDCSPESEDPDPLEDLEALEALPSVYLEAEVPEESQVFRFGDDETLVSYIVWRLECVVS